MAGTRSRRGVLLLLVVSLAVAVLAQAGWAAPVPSQTATAGADTAGAQAIAAERQLIQGRLMDFGLTEKDAASRVGLLSDEEVHAITADLEAIQAAGATSGEQWDTLTVLLLLILVAILAD